MSVVIFPRRHAGQRQPGAFVFGLPLIQMTVERSVYNDVDTETQAAVLAEIRKLEASIAAASESSARLVALMKPFVVEATG